MANIKLILDKRRNKENATYPIMIRIVHSRNNAQIALGYSVSENNWDDMAKEVLKSSGLGDVKRINNFIIKKKIEAQDVVNRLADLNELDDLSARELRIIIEKALFGKKEEVMKLETIKREVNKQNNGKTMLLVECQTIFYNFMKNIGIPKHKQRIRTKDYIENNERYLNRFIEFLNNKGYKVESLKINQITDEIVGQYYEHVQSISDNPSTFNHHFRTLKSFYNYFIDERDYIIKNPFKQITLRYERKDKQTITRQEFDELLTFVTSENSFIEYPNERKNMYRSWLIHAYKFALYTGRRREELVMIKWSDIKVEKNGEPVYIASFDYKANRLSNYDNSKKEKIVFIPISDDLRELLIEMGLELYKDTERFVIAPEETISRKAVIDLLSKSFSFFYKKLGTGRDVSFKHLRKTYLTRMEILTGNAIAISGHSSNAVLMDHYIDGTEIARNLSKVKFRIFN